MKNNAEKGIKNILETFQLNLDFHSTFFDISANYYDVTDSELGISPPTGILSDQILDVGGAFGEVDITRIPWDSENKELTIAEALWGIVPPQASMTLFNKIYLAKQLNNINSISFDENNNQHYEDPQFSYGTDDKTLTATLETANGMAQFLVPLLAGHLEGSLSKASGLEHDMKVSARASELRAKIKAIKAKSIATGPMQSNGTRSYTQADLEAGSQKIADEAAAKSTKLEQEAAAAGTDAEKAAKNAERTAANALKETANAAKGVMHGGLGIGKLYMWILKQIFPKTLFKILGGLKNVILAAGSYVKEGIKAGLKEAAYALSSNGRKAADAGRAAAEDVAAKGGDKAAQNAAKDAAKATERAAQEATASVAKKELLKAAELAAEKEAVKLAESVGLKRGLLLSKSLAKFVLKGILTSPLAIFSLAWIVPCPPLFNCFWIGAILDEVYMFVVMPLLMILSLPGCPITVAIENLGPADGCCPAGTVAFDVALPSPAETIISMFPVTGDIIGFLYPVACLEDGTGAILPKGELPVPKYLNYQWLSSYYFDWPQYDCTNGMAHVIGKTKSAVGGISLGTLDPWTYLPYTDLNTIIDDPYGHKHVSAQLKGFTKTYNSNYIVPQDQNFFYCDFSHPNVLLRMAQFYYDNATRNPELNPDGTVTIQFISKINYVVASSLVTCDVLCEMNNITYNPVTGKQYSEVQSYNHDRRFYFGATGTSTTYDKGPHYWETIADNNWKAIDDAYDTALIMLNALIHSYPFHNTNVEAEFLATAYRLMINSSNKYVYAMSNIPNDDDYDMNLVPFLSQFQADQANYENLFKKLGVNDSNTSGTVHYIPLGTTYPPAVAYTALNMNQFTQLPNLNNNAISNATLYVSTFVGCSNAYWNYQITLSNQQPTYNLYSNYIVYGCTHIDSTAGNVLDPSIAAREIDGRKQVDFPTTFLLKRCTQHFMDLRQCIDLSNIETIVNAYSVKFPNVHIKNIKSIKAKGQNVCQFIWDQVDVDLTSQMETNYRTVTNNILYQIDLSSCTFCLPGSNNPQLYGTTVNTIIASDTITTSPPSSVPMYVNPVDSNSPNYTLNTTLQHNKAFYYHAIRGNMNGSNIQTSNMMIGVIKIEDIDDIKRFNPVNGAPLPDLIRPKRPIRIHYPKPIEKTLGNLSNDICGLPENIKNFILDYNAVPANNKIAKVVRAYTTSADVCDMEVDLLVGNNVQRRTLTYKMKPEPFQNIEGFDTLQQYTYDSPITTQQGLNIQNNTSGLPGSWSTIGYGFALPYLSTLNPKVGSNNQYFNDDLIKTFTNSTRGLKNTTNTFLVGLAGTQHLGDNTCTNKCDEPAILQRIVEQYNIDGFPNSRYDISQNSVIQSYFSVTASPTKCHVVFENKKDTYADAFSPKTFMYADYNDPYDPSHNYSTENRLLLKEVNMKQLPGCKFVPISPGPGQTYKDISATDLALSTQFDMDSLTDGTAVINATLPLRSTCQVNCATQNPNAAITDYQNTTGSAINKVYAYMKTGYDTCDYYVNNNTYYVQPRAVSDPPYNNVEGVLRVKYTYPTYNTNNLIEGQSYTCSGSTDPNGNGIVYRAVGGFLCRYPNPSIATSWSSSWATNVMSLNCSGLQFGPDMQLYPKAPLLPCGAYTYTTSNYQMQVPGDTLTALDKDISPLFDYDPNDTSALNTDANVHLIPNVKILASTTPSPWTGTTK